MIEPVPSPNDKYRSGGRAGHCVMYHSSTYPCGAMGPVEFLWKREKEREGKSLLRVWDALFS